MVKRDRYEDITCLEELAGTPIHDIDVGKTLDYFTKMFVEPLKAHFKINECMVIDCAAGFGWFAMAYVLAGGKGVIAAEIDKEKCNVSRKIANRLSLGDKIQFLNCPMQELPFKHDEVELFVSIETIEHVGMNNRLEIFRTLEKMRDVASVGILLTTPNKIFPIIAHDTRLPLIHYLPPKRRNRLARLFGRTKKNKGNEFVSPMDLNILMDKFHPVTSCLAFNSYKEYESKFPYYLPYRAGGKSYSIKTKPSVWQAIYYRIVSSIFRTKSYYVMPNLKVIMKRNDSVPYRKDQPAKSTYKEDALVD